MAKRKREADPRKEQESQASKRPKAPEPPSSASPVPQVVQIVAGSYDRVLHGLTATISTATESAVEFADTFLFDAHTSAIKCLAISPPSAPAPGQTQRVMLATGGTDERINVYNISAHPPRQDAHQQLISSLAPRPVLENRKNRELGTLLHHSSTVTKLSFPTRSKLMSAAEDSTIAVTRTRDWSLLSAVKAPIPKSQGRPSGDTAPMGGVPSGVNDFAVHPSMKLMISVSKGERSMRLWNLVTGKKAGVLNFGKEVLHEIGEGKYSMGEGRSVVWGSSDGGDEFAVGFDREVVVYGMDGTPRCRTMGNIKTKVHRVQYVHFGEGNGSDAVYLAVSTEDGQVRFFSTMKKNLMRPANGGAAAAARGVEPLSTAKLVGRLGGKECGVNSRIKDFTILPAQPGPGVDHHEARIVVSGNSDGKLGVWRVTRQELAAGQKSRDGQQVGKLLGSYETQNRITCITAFNMIPSPKDSVEEEESEDGDNTESEEEDGDE